MTLELIRKENNLLEIKLKNERHSLPNLLVKTLLESKDVEFAAYKLRHPADADALIIIRTKKGKPEKAIESAFKQISKDLQEFKSEVKKIK